MVGRPAGMTVAPEEDCVIKIVCSVAPYYNNKKPIFFNIRMVYLSHLQKLELLYRIWHSLWLVELISMVSE